jgi:hypothetical protein
VEFLKEERDSKAQTRPPTLSIPRISKAVAEITIHDTIIYRIVCAETTTQLMKSR